MLPPLLSLLPARFRGRDAAVLGDCLVCNSPVRERDDRMRFHGRYVHTTCAGYRIRSLARARSLGSGRPSREFTGD